jgi:Arc/MetJ family transcription regulator
MYILEAEMAVAITSIRLDTELADEAVKLIGANSRTDAIHIALKEIVSTERFKNLLLEYGGKGSFAGSDEGSK